MATTLIIASARHRIMNEMRIRAEPETDDRLAEFVAHMVRIEQRAPGRAAAKARRRLHA